MSHSESAPESDSSFARREALYMEEMQRNLPRNFAANLFHGMLGLTGFRLMYAPTFVPTYVASLSGSDVAVGFALGAQFLGMAMSSIWGATMIEHRQRVFSVVYSLGWVVRLQIFGLAVSAFLLGGQWALIAACTFLMLFGFFSGMQGVAFNVLMSKVIPTNQRGKLMGTRNFLGGLIAAGVAYLSATYLVDRNMFGSGYGSTFMLAFILTSLGITALTFVREPQALSVRERSAGFLERLADIPHMLRNDPNYRRFFIARGLGALGSAAVPFYMLHIRKFIPPSEAAGMLGLFSLAFLLPPTFSNLVWGRIADAKGYRLVYLLSVGLWCGSTMLLIFGSSMPVFLLAACGLGTGQAGYMMASQSFVLEFGKPHEVPMLIAVSDTASHLMMIIGPVMGGLLARQAGYASVFWCSLVFLLIAVMTVWQIQEPRDRKPVPARMDND